MYFYNSLAILLGILAIYLGFVYAFRPKYSQAYLNNKIFKKGEKVYYFWYSLVSFLIGITLATLGIIEFFDFISFDDKELYFCLSYMILVLLYLFIGKILDYIYLVKKD